MASPKKLSEAEKQRQKQRAWAWFRFEIQDLREGCPKYNEALDHLGRQLDKIDRG